MIAIALSFPAGRYHATPWGRHVNEGAVEWPPSPWRLLRALVAVWKRTLSDVPQESVEPIFRAIAAPPRFVLPPASTGHTRHYMPWEKGWKADEPGKAKTKVFDAFVVVAPDSPVIACWPAVDLDSSQRELLARLLANINFLGRGESWCEARLMDSDEASADCESVNCESLSESHPAPVEHELVRTLCPDPASAFADEHVVDEEVTTQGKGKSKVTTTLRRPCYDPNWNLCMETLRLHEQKWSDPPGSTWLAYTRPRDCFDIAPRRAKAHRRGSPAPQVFRFALDSAVLPLAIHTLPVAEAARRALMSLQGRLSARDGVRGRSDMLSGKDEKGTPLCGHAHAYFLPTDEDGDGRLDHLTIFARGGFGESDIRAVEQLRQIRPHGRDNASHPLRVLLLGQGKLEDHQRGPIGVSCSWISATPYVAIHHAKRRGKHRTDLGDWRSCVDFLCADLREQLRKVRSDLAEETVSNAAITALPSAGPFRVANRWRPIEFVRSRDKHRDRGVTRPSGAFRIEFPTEVTGPISTGSCSHFGLGMFVPTVIGVRP